MLIWGSKGKSKVVNRGTFFCPNCQRNSPYKYCELGKYFTLYFLPIFQTKKITDYVECEVCGMQYRPSVLDHNPEENVRQIIRTISTYLDKGQPIHLVIEQLISKGLEKENAAKLVFIALDGSYVECTYCGSFFSTKIEFCSLCGKRLVNH